MTKKYNIEEVEERYNQRSNLNNNQHFDEVDRIGLDNAATHRHTASLKSRSGKYEEAIEDYTKVIQVDPSDARAYHDRGKAKYHIGDYHGAIEDYTKAIEIDPSDAIYYD